MKRDRDRETERERERERERLDLAWAFETSKPTPSDSSHPIKANLLQQGHIFQSFPNSLLPGDKIFNYASLWGPFLFQPPQVIF